MNHMMVVETRDPLECRDVEWSAALLSGLREGDVTCTLMLAENGVLAARAGVRSVLLSGLVDGGVEVLADRFALAERGIADSDLAAGIAGADLGVVVDRLAAGGAVIWR